SCLSFFSSLLRRPPPSSLFPYTTLFRSLPELLIRLLADPYFALPPPKSTGRDYFHLEWLARALAGTESAPDVEATLTALTARTKIGRASCRERVKSVEGDGAVEGRERRG